MMQCGLRIPSISNAFHVSVEPAELTANVRLRWPSVSRALEVSMFVDTGCNVDMVASPRLADMIRETTPPIRTTRLHWGGWQACEVFTAEVETDRWRTAEIYAPLEEDCEDLLGLPLVLRSNLCIRGDAGAAFWVEMSDPRRPDEWVGRDVDQVPRHDSDIRRTRARSKKPSRG